MTDPSFTYKYRLQMRAHGRVLENFVESAAPVTDAELRPYIEAMQQGWEEDVRLPAPPVKIIPVMIAGELVSELIPELLERRRAARAAGNFIEADKLRAEIEAAGFVVEDPPVSELSSKEPPHA